MKTYKLTTIGKDLVLRALKDKVIFNSFAFEEGEEGILNIKFTFTLSPPLYEEDKTIEEEKEREVEYNKRKELIAEIINNLNNVQPNSNRNILQNI